MKCSSSCKHKTPIVSFAVKASLFVVLLLCQSQLLFSQHSVNGQVMDTDGAPLIGVTILEKDTGNGTTTDFDGKFSLTVNQQDAALVFSYIGYESQTVALNGKSEITLILEEASNQLDEVVVTALGIKRQKRSLGYSTESFGGVEILESNAANIVSSLSGRSAGVNIATPNGVEGGTSRITIRGNNNITGNNQPLIVMDGVPIENPPGMQNIGRGRDWGSPINNINPEDIAEVNILKGPTASALYGSRGANGVMLISTKKGRQYKKGIGVVYAISHKVIQPSRFRDVQNVYGGGGPVSLLEPQLEQNDEGEYQFPGNFDANEGPFGKSTEELFGFYSTGVSWGPKMNGEMVRWWDGQLRPYDPQPDNLGLYFKNGHTTRHNISFSGGNDKGSIRVSLSATDHDAPVPESNFQQYTAQIGSNINISSRVNADISFNYVRYERLNTPSLGDDNEDSFGKGILYSWPRSYKGIEKEINILPDGTRNDYNGQYPYRFSPPHLWWNTYNNKTINSRDLLIGAFTVNYDVTSWLKATGRIGMNFTTEQFEVRKAPTDLLGIENGFYSNELARDRVNNNEFIITAYKDNILPDFDVSLAVGGTQWQRGFYGLRGQSTEWINAQLYTFNNAEDTTRVPVPTEFRFDKKINSVYSMLDIAFRNYLFLQVSGRNDWSSALPLENNDYFYPSASLSFIASEAFGLSNKWLSFLKLRGAYAQTGTDTDPFQLDFVYNTASFGGVQTATLPGTVPPIALRPQRANSYETGLTAGFFNDKINLDLTYYYIKSYDQILNSPVPISSGASEITTNSAVLENRGIEAKLDINLWHGKNSYGKTSFNFSRNRNRVASLGNGAKSIELADIWGYNGPAIAVREGENYGTIFGYDYVYHEVSGKPILNEDGTHYLITESRVPVGNAAPDFTGGWTTEFGYKGFSLSTLVDTKWGGDIYAGSYVIGLQTGQSPETLLEREGGGLPYTDPDGNTRNIGVILDGVYADGTPNEKVVHYYFKYLPNAGGWGRFLTTPGVLDNTWVKLREVALSYSFGNELLEKTRIFQDLRLALVGRDLFYLYSSLPDRINPEGSNGSGNAQGLEWASFPGMRSFSVRLEARF